MKAFTRRHALMIAILGFVAYAPTLRVGFIWDDHVMIVHNPHLQDSGLKALQHDFTTDNTLGKGDNYYRPLQLLSIRFDHALWGLRPFGYHVSNLLFHLIGSVLLAYFVVALGYAPLAALLTGCLFAVHPIGVEQFLAVTGRGTPMSFFFTMATLLLLIRKQRWTFPAGLIAYALALLSKENSAITPALLALTIWYLRLPKRYYRRVLWLLVLTAGYWFLRQSMVAAPPSFSMKTLGLFMTLAFPRILLHYATLLMVPWNLHSHRLIPSLSHAWPFLLLLVTCIPLRAAYQKRRTLLFFFGWFVLSLCPMIPPMITGGFMLDHWGYPMAPALLTPLGLLFTSLWLSPKNERNQKWSLLYFPLLIGWALLVPLNVELRGTEEKIYRWALHFTTSNPIKYNLGIYYLNSGQAEKAIPLFEEVKLAYPHDVANRYALAKAFWQTGHKPLALRYLRDLTRLTPPYEPAIHTLATLHPKKTYKPFRDEK